MDPDVDLHDAAQAAEIRSRPWGVLAAIAIGGVIGSEARYGVGELVPHSGRQFPWATLVINASGSLLIGALMVLIFELTAPHRLARPFLGVGVLGGYTTFSTFAVDVQRLLLAHRAATALEYVLATVVACLAAVWLAAGTTRLAARAVTNTRMRRSQRSSP
ncbi:MAG: fluoride exporter [Pseudonocardiales bacterium]|nr:fluoride exporter [Pseudonocardiales bacterium]